MKSRRAIALVSAGICIAIGALAGAGIALAHRGEAVGSIDGHEVTRDELVFHMRRLAPTVENELRNKYHLPAVTDWTTPVAGRTALDLLAARALDEIWRDKATLVLAEEHGLAVPVDYKDLTAELAAENKRRADAVATGETVYGVTEFSADEYYSHRLTQVTTALKQALSANPAAPLWVDASDVRRAFDAHREAWSANATTYRYSRLVVPVPHGAAPDYAARLQRRVVSAARLADVAAREPGATISTGTYGGSGSANTNGQDLMAVLGTLHTGDISVAVTGTGQITYYQLDKKTVDADAALAEYSVRIRQSVVEAKFQQFLQRRVHNSDIEVAAAAVDAINAEDVQP